MVFMWYFIITSNARVTQIVIFSSHASVLLTKSVWRTPALLHTEKPFPDDNWESKVALLREVINQYGSIAMHQQPVAVQTSDG